MTLAIDRFYTRCRAAPGAAIDRGAIERLVREEFPGSCAAVLGEAFALQRGIVRLRQLRLKLRVDRRDWDSRQLAQQWSAAFAQSLRQALAMPGSADLVRHDEPHEWIAAVIEALVTSSVRGDWRFEEYEHLASLPLDRALQMLIEDGAPLERILNAVARRGIAPSLLRALSDDTVERWVARLDAVSGDAVASPEQILILIGKLLQLHETSPFSPDLPARAALAAWLQACADGCGSTWSVARSGLKFVAAAIRALRENCSTETFSGHASGLRAIEHATLLRQVVIEDGNRTRPQSPSIAALSAQLRQLASANLTVAARTTEVAFSSDFAGLLLLVGSIARLEWPQRIRRSALWQRSKERALTYLLAEVGMRIAQHASLARDRDPAIAVFAGWLDEPDWAGVERFRATVTPEEQTDLARAMDIEADPVSWSQLVERCTRQLLREFGNTIRGFRNASEAFIVQKLLAVRGELRIDEQRIAVVLAPSPYHVALHVCSGFTKLEAVSWLGWRDLVFHPGGA